MSGYRKLKETRGGFSIYAPNGQSNDRHVGNGKPQSSGRPGRPAKIRKPYPTLDAAIEAAAKYAGGSVEARYEYTDSFYRVRICTSDGKVFQPIHREEDKWYRADPPGPLPLYKVDDIGGAARVYIVEGEKCVDLACNLGLIAVTSGSSSSAAKADWSKLAGRECIILPDNDDKGRDYARDVALILTTLHCTVRIVELPEVPDKGDIVEYVQQRDGMDDAAIVAEIHALADAARIIDRQTQPAPDVNGQTGEPAAPEPLRLRTVRELVSEFPNLRPPLIDGLLRRGETVNIIAPSKVGKSWLVTSAALCVTTGRPFLDCPTTPGDVLIIDNELHEETSANRIPKVADALGIGFDEYADRIKVVNLRGKLRDLNELTAELGALGTGRFALVIVDALYRALPAGTDENSNANMAALFNRIDVLAARLGCAVAVIHHASKGGQGAKNTTDVGAGAGAQSRAADTHLVLRPHEEAGAFVLDAAVRSFPPVTPSCLRWQFPLFISAPDLDVTKLKTERPRPGGAGWTAERFAREFIVSEPRQRKDIVAAAMRAGLSRRKTVEMLGDAVELELAFKYPRRNRAEPECLSILPPPSEQGGAS